MEDEYIRDGKVHYVVITLGDDDRFSTSILTRSVFEPVPLDTHTQMVDSWHQHRRDAEARCDTLNKEFASQQETGE